MGTAIREDDKGHARSSRKRGAKSHPSEVALDCHGRQDAEAARKLFGAGL